MLNKKNNSGEDTCSIKTSAKLWSDDKFESSFIYTAMWY